MNIAITVNILFDIERARITCGKGFVIRGKYAPAKSPIFRFTLILAPDSLKGHDE